MYTMFDFGGVPSILLRLFEFLLLSSRGCLCRLQLWREAIFFCENREKMGGVCNWVVVSNILYFHLYLRKISNLTHIFQMG